MGLSCKRQPFFYPPNPFSQRNLCANNFFSFFSVLTRKPIFLHPAHKNCQVAKSGVVRCKNLRNARVAKLVDAPSSGGGVRKDVLVRIQSRAQKKPQSKTEVFFVI